MQARQASIAALAHAPSCSVALQQNRTPLFWTCWSCLLLYSGLQANRRSSRGVRARVPARQAALVGLCIPALVPKGRGKAHSAACGLAARVRSQTCRSQSARRHALLVRSSKKLCLWRDTRQTCRACALGSNAVSHRLLSCFQFCSVDMHAHVLITMCIAQSTR